MGEAACFVLCNYGLLHRGVEMGDTLGDFAGSMLVPEDEAEELQAKRVHALQRGRLLSDAELVEEEAEQAEGEHGAEDEGEEDAESEGEGEADQEEDAEAEVVSRREIKWGALPEGLEVAPKPTKLDDTLVGSMIYMRWGKPHGCCMGRVALKFTMQANPRLFKKFNFRVKWDDGWDNHVLVLEKYMSGATAPYDSWVLLQKAASEPVATA